jgi:hypothetical protein
MPDDTNRNRDARTDEKDEMESTADSKTKERNDSPNPPRTTKGGWTSPKFGSSGSGGAELEPGPERD